MQYLVQAQEIEQSTAGVLPSGVCRISLCFTSNVLYIVPVSLSVGGLHEALCRLMYNIAVGGSLLVSAPT